MTTAYWVTGDARQVMAELPAASIDLLITSPPFLALRSYLPADHPDKAAEMGSEATPGEFIDALLDITEAAARLLTPHGSICVELGDTYAGSGGAGGDYNADGLRAGQSKSAGSASLMRESYAALWRQRNTARSAWPLDKSLCLIPELYRLALAYGFNPFTGRTTERWRVRNTITWVRPNPPVGALGDKFRPATSDLVVACKAKDRWFDLDSVRTPSGYDRPGGLRQGTPKGTDERRALNGETANMSGSNPAGAPPLDWWQINPTGFRGSHYAVFPEELCVRPIEAMCPRRVCRSCGQPSRRITKPTDEYDAARCKGDFFGKDNNDRDAGLQGQRLNGRPNAEYTTTGWSTCGCPGADGLRLDGWHTGTGWRPGTVLDPFAGTGTVGAVATGHGRDAILIDLDVRNLALARERVGMFLVETTATDLAALLEPGVSPRT